MHLKSLQSKTRLLLSGVFASLIIFSVWHSAHSQRNMVANLANEMASDKARGYFDGVNTMMLTGTAGQRDVLRNKILSDDNITDLRLIRGEAITKIFGKGNPEQAIQDDIDKRGLAGENIAQFSNDKNGRLITVVTPFKASSDFRGTNCLSCHQVPEGTVLGAVRISYSLATMDKEITSSLITNSIITTVVIIIGMILITVFMRKVVIKPLTDIQNTINTVMSDYNLTHRVKVTSDDEIAHVGMAFNNMLEQFSNILHQVSNTTLQLDDASSRISSVSSQTATAAIQQKTETQSVSASIHQLERSSQSVNESADSVASASIQADTIAKEGSGTTQQAIAGINTLVSEIELASTVITQLDERSHSVEAVLDVIKSIAEQTNLLALNAAIEAARAGEQGRGFAVVADEVRELANRSHQSTQEIEKIIAQLQAGAKEAVSAMNNAKESAEERSKQVHEADQKLKVIAEHVTEINHLNNVMVNISNEQNQITQSVSDSVANINNLSEKTEDNAERTANVSQDLVNLAGELNKLINKFQFK